MSANQQLCTAAETYVVCLDCGRTKTKRGDGLQAEYRFDYTKSEPNRLATRIRPGALAVMLDPDVARELKKGRNRTRDAERSSEFRPRIGLREATAKVPTVFKVEPFLATVRLNPGIDPDKLNQFLDDLEVEDYLRKQNE